jgi:hypothetical protein
MQSAEEFAAERSRRRLIGIAAQFDLPGGRRVNIVRVSRAQSISYHDFPRN